MALETKVKTVLFHDGPFDETDRFLLRAPATDYIENLHFHRQGNLQKRPGNELLDTVPNATGDPFFLHSINNGLHTLTEDGARSLSDGDWTETDATGFIGTKKMELETPPTGGLGHVSFETFGTQADPDSIEFYVVVGEVREQATQQGSYGQYIDTARHVVVQQYDKYGNFQRQTRLDGARSPKVVKHADADFAGLFLRVFYVRDSDKHLVSQTYNPLASSPLGSEIDTTIPIAIEYSLKSHAGDAQDLPPLNPTAGLSHTRLGGSQDGNARYHISVNTAADEYFVAYRRTPANVTVYAATLDASGQMVSGSSFQLPWDLDTTYEVLDIAWDRFGLWRNAYVLRASINENTRLSTIILDKIDFEPTPTVTWTRTMYATTGSHTSVGERLNPSLFTHGGLTVVNDVAWFAHDAGPSVGRNADGLDDLWYAARHWDQGLRYGVRDAAGDTVYSTRTLPAHRLATRPFWLGGELYAGVQQHIDHDSLSRLKSNEGPLNVGGARVPRTTVLVCFGDGSESPRPVAYVGAGRSKVTEYAESDFAVHTPSVRFDGNPDVSADIFFPNRIVTRAEDLTQSYWDSGSGALWNRMGAAESPADSLVRIHRITKGNGGEERVSSTNLGDGVVLATAVPLWFDGRFFGEVGPIDQPEIISVRDDRMMLNTGPDSRVPQGYSVLTNVGSGPEDWRKLQVVTGYYDTRGNKHRSAPSSVLYVWGFNPSDNAAMFPTSPASAFPNNWQGRSTRVYYTPPLTTLPNDVDYFAEVYASDGPDDTPRLIDTSPVGIDDIRKLHYVEVQLLRYTGYATGEGGEAFALPARSSEDIYTAGGELPADPWPSFSRAVATSTRLIAIDAVNKGKLLVSKKFQDFIAPEYNALLDVNLGDERNLLCIGRLDDKVVVFEKDDIHVLYGDGPNNDGTGEDFAIHYIATDVGCQDQESIIECPAGLVFFRQERGFYLLDRQLNVKYIGDKVHDLTKGIDVVSAELVSSAGEVRFLCAVTGAQGDPDGGFAAILGRPPTPVRENKAPDSNFAIVWDYEKDQWSVFANYPGSASAIHQGRYTRLLSDWTIWQEREGSDRIFTDPTGNNRTLLRTPWIPIAENEQGYGRLHRMNVLGRYLATLGQTFAIPFQYYACDIRVKVWYDYEEGRDVTPQTKLFKYEDFWFDPFSNRNLRAQRLQFVITPAEGRGRCQSVKLEFEEMVPADAPDGKTYQLGQGFEISSIDFEIGVDQRVTRHLPKAVLK